MSEFTAFELHIVADGRVLSVTFKFLPQSQGDVVDNLVDHIVAAFAEVAEQDMPGSSRLVEKSISILHDPARHTISLRRFYQSSDYPARFEAALRQQSKRVVH